jgi:hypothetical protein
MAQAVSCRPLTAEARFCARVSPPKNCDGQSGTGTGFSQSNLLRVVSINFPPWPSIIIHIIWG